MSRGRAEEEERAARTAGVQEQREDCGSEDWGGLPRREEGCRNKGGSVVAELGHQEGRTRGKVKKQGSSKRQLRKASTGT